MIVSHAQQFEDVMLWRALKHVDNGAYIDIGANDPVADSVSLLFYEKGWRGVHVEPMPEFTAKLREMRENEIVIEAVVSDDPEPVTLFSFDGTGLTTAIPDHARKHEQDNREARLFKAESVTLASVFERFNRRHIHWLKVDVEGMEAAVLRSWGDEPTRPWIVVVESTLPNSQELAFEEWEGELTSRGYSITYFDGLNRFYVHDDHVDLKSSFDVPPNFFDRFLISETSPFAGLILGGREQARAEVARLEGQLGQLSKEHDALNESHNTLHLTVAHRDAHIHRIESELTASVLANQELLEINAERSRRLSKSAEENERLRQRTDQLLAQASSYKAQIDHLNAQAIGYRDQVEAVRGSTSWKVSAPVRWVGGGVRRTKGALKSMLRFFMVGGLRVARANPWIKKPALAVANLAPPLRRKIDHFSMVRPAPRGPHTLGQHHKFVLTADADALAEWAVLLKLDTENQKAAS